MNKITKKGYPFAAIVGQEDMKLALILNIINPSLGGILIQGEKGTAKSTAVRALASLLGKTYSVKDCRFNCDYYETAYLCKECKDRKKQNDFNGIERFKKVVELPVSSTEDRVVGTLDIEKAIKEGIKEFEPGILAQANNNILYVDEVNLLDDHVVDVLLDCAAMGVNTVEREGVSFSHPSRFVLVGTMNPEEGDLRPQLLDRFGLFVQIKGERNKEFRKEIIKRRLQYENNTDSFVKSYSKQEDEIKSRIMSAKKLLLSIDESEEIYDIIVDICMTLEVDGHRADITLLKAARTIAAYKGETSVNKEHVLKAAQLVLPHRMRRLPFQDTVLDMQRIEEIING